MVWGSPSDQLLFGVLSPKFAVPQKPSQAILFCAPSCLCTCCPSIDCATPQPHPCLPPGDDMNLFSHSLCPAPCLASTAVQWMFVACINDLLNESVWRPGLLLEKRHIFFSFGTHTISREGRNQLRCNLLIRQYLASMPAKVL